MTFSRTFPQTFSGLAVLVAATAVSALTLAGCSVSVDVKTKTKYTLSGGATATATKDWVAGAPIEVANANGTVEVRGVPGLTKIAVTAKPFSFADTKEDGDKAIADVQASVVVEERASGGYFVRCSQSKQDYGTAPQGLSGCDDFVVQVPAGQGVRLKATAENGGLTASSLTVEDGQAIILRSDNGTVTVTGVTGGAEISSGNGDVEASVTPTKGCNVSVKSENGDVTLSLPTSFSADRVTFSGETTDVTAFTGLTSGSTRGDAGSGASTIDVVATGKATLKAF